MKKIYSLLLGAVALLSACHDPQYVEPTANRQGLTSLTAIFTSGPFVDQEMAKLTIDENMGDRLVIPVPWFYPETSDDETSPYMTKVRVRAELQENCSIEPALTILDLTKDNYFTYTNAQGVKKQIVITGERVKSSKCELTSFTVQNPAISGVVDKTNKKVSLVSADDLSACLATAEVSAHATISPDPATTELNYNDPVEFTVTAHDGVTSATYTVVKEIPEKIPAGFNSESLELLFNFDPVSNLGLPNYTTDVSPSMAALGGHLVICLGDGSTPIYVNQLTGVKQGTIALGSASACSVTSDEGEHMLIVNHADGGGKVQIYTTSSVTEAPTLFHEFTNSTDLPMGYDMKVIGDITKDAIITITNEGISGVTSSSKATCILVRSGVVTATSVIDLSATGAGWGAAPVNIGTVVTASTDPTDGCFNSYYGGNFIYVKGDGTVSASMGNDNTGWGLNANNLDSKQFNNVNYLALFVVSHFPSWGMGPQLYLYNTTDKTQISGSDAWSCPALVLNNQSIEWYQKAANGTASGDVLIAPSKDGFKLYVYYYDHNSGVIGGYSADCIKRD